jgi:D-glycero-alpha-D-manno-heptose-7-phosphate kinase
LRMRIRAKAPTRIDLAGGTLDISPLYLLHPGSITINLAISLYTSVEIRKRADRKIIIISEDKKKRLEAEGVDLLPDASPLDLVVKAVKYIKPKSGLTITTNSEPPEGSGLGGSSSLLIAILFALESLSGKSIKPDERIRLAMNLEASVIGVPTGCQDYFPASFGGLSAIKLTPEGAVREELPLLEELPSHLLLAYSGTSRFSGSPNWEVVKRRIDGDGEVKKSLHGLRDISREMYRALKSGDYQAIPGLFAAEFELRETLPGKSLPKELKAVIAEAEDIGASAKVMGAGGGGCILFFTAPDKRRKLSRFLEQKKLSILPFAPVREGLIIEKKPILSHGK